MKSRILSVLLMMILLVSGTTVTTFAAGSGFSVRISAEQDYAKAQEVLRLINKERTKRGLKKLSLDKSLSNAAILRAAESAVYIPVTSPHRRPTGKVYRSVNKKTIYECCAQGYSTPEKVVYAWMHSKPHRRGILLKNAKSVGIGCITLASGGYSWTLEFGAKKAKKKVKRRDIVTYTKKVVAKKKYNKPQYFKICDIPPVFEAVEYPIEIYDRIISTDGIAVKEGNTQLLAACYSSKWSLGHIVSLPKSDVTWSSGDSSVATVDSNGRLTAISEGETVITATMTSSPGYSMSRRVIVYMD